MIHSKSVTDRQEQPVLLIYALTIVSSIGTVSWIGNSTYFYGLTAILLAILFAYVILLHPMIRLHPLVATLFAIYLLWLSLITVLSPESLKIAPYLLSTPFILLFIFTLPALVIRHKEIIPYFLSITGALVTVIGVLLLLGGDTSGLELRWTGRSTYFDLPYRIQSLFSNSNNLGFFLAPAALSSLFLAAKYASPIGVVLLLINLTGIFLSHSRSTLLGIAIGIIFFVIYKRVHHLFYLTALGIVLAHVYILSGTANQEWLASLISNRNYHIIASVQHIQQFPIFGDYLRTVDTEVQLDRGIPGSHHTYFSLLTRAGIGGAAYLFGILYIFVIAVRNCTTLWERYVVSVVASYLIIMAFESITVGGLSVAPILLATFLGFAHHSAVTSPQED